MASEPAFCSLAGKLALVTGASRGIGRAIAEELARAGAEVVVGYRSGKDEAEELALRDRRPRRPGRCLDARGREATRRRGGRHRRARQQRGPDPRRSARADVGRRLAHGDRHEPQLGLLHLPRGDAADDEEARRLDRQHQLDRRRARQLGPDELRRVEGRDHRLHEVARARARLARSSRERRRPGLREDAAHGRAAGGGDRGDGRLDAARPCRRASRDRRRGTLPRL